MALKRRCRGCGYIFEITGGEFVCPHCGTRQSASITPEMGDILISAGNYRRNGEFVKAIAEYKRVIALNPEIGESYWGIFLSEYRVSDEKGDMFTTVNKNSAFDNHNFNKALELASYNRTTYLTFTEELERQRLDNLRFSDEILKNDYHAVLLADCNPKDLGIAYDLYEYLKTRVNVFYPRLTLKSFPEKTALRISLLALEKMRLGFAICSEQTIGGQDFSLMYRTFLRNKPYLYLIGEDEIYVPSGLNYNGDIILPDEKLNDSVLTKIRIMGNFSLEERAELRSDGKLSKIQTNPSPEIFYERS